MCGCWTTGTSTSAKKVLVLTPKNKPCKYRCSEQDYKPNEAHLPQYLHPFITSCQKQSINGPHDSSAKLQLQRISPPEEGVFLHVCIQQPSNSQVPWVLNLLLAVVFQSQALKCCGDYLTWEWYFKSMQRSQTSVSFRKNPKRAWSFLTSEIIAKMPKTDRLKDSTPKSREVLCSAKLSRVGRHKSRRPQIYWQFYSSN